MATGAVQFIEFEDDSKELRVTDDARRLLSSLETTVSVCSVAGVYRTGKSFILNQLAGRDATFDTGSSVQACTKGIWMSIVPLDSGASPNNLVLLDTEGLQSIAQSEFTAFPSSPANALLDVSLPD